MVMSWLEEGRSRALGDFTHTHTHTHRHAENREGREENSAAFWCGMKERQGSVKKQTKIK